VVYELWDLSSRNLVDWIEDRAEALAAVRAHLDAGEADMVMLVVRDAAEQPIRTHTGPELVRWAELTASEVRRSA
jgi:hypothetical protein